MSQFPGLSTRHLGRVLLAFEELDSTNTYLKENGGALSHGTVAVAAHQTAGKGRLGRSWSEHSGQCLAMSVLLKDLPTQALSLLPLLAGLAVSQALEALCHTAFPIKWSNDVLCDNGKVCGILCESRIGPGGAYAVAGIGVNLTQTRQDFSRYGLVYANSLFLATGKKIDPLAVGAHILNYLEPILEEYRQNGFSGSLLAAYCSRCITLGRQVLLHTPQTGEKQQGIALEICPDGSLLCEIGGVRRQVVAGEVSVRGIYGYV